MHPLMSNEVGRRELWLGNEAVVRGAIEAGVGLVTGYPGTPASEIGDLFHQLQGALDIPFEYSVNEKVALELAFGASLTGVRALTSMKHLGLTYAADPLSTMPYIGVVGGLVIVSAADPGCLTSPNEQDQRHLGRMLGLPTLDPATPDEARRMTAFAFELSESSELPVLLRITTRVCHSRAAVELGAVQARRPRGRFRKDPSRFLPTPAHARGLRERLQGRLDRACVALTASPFNVATWPAAALRRGVVAGGAPRNVVRHVIASLGLQAPLLELGALHPLPHDIIVPFLRGLDEVIVVEELTPYLEDSLLAMAQHYGVAARVHGKRDGRMPWPFELEPLEVERRLRDFFGLPPAAEANVVRQEAIIVRQDAIVLPPRPPVLCPGCLHRNVFHAAAAVFGEDRIYVNDIGCYTLGVNPPYRAGDVLLAMGSSIPLAAGIARATGERVVAFIGDSTFYHSGMPALLNAIEHHDEVVVVVLDNHITAMTGFQPNPGSGAGPSRRRIGDVARALGADDVAVIDAADVPGLIRLLHRAREARGPSVVVAEGPCALQARREQIPERRSYLHIDPASCHRCGMSETGLPCGLPPSTAVQRQRAVQRAVNASGRSAGPIPVTSPCSAQCPLGICIPAYVGAIAAGEPERALQAVSLRAALPSVCAYICHRPCEEVCIQRAQDGPVRINELKRYLTENLSPLPQPSRLPDGPKVAIVGAGPAGLAAARELQRRGYAPTLFDAHERPGGMLEYAVPDYRLPREVLRRDIQVLLDSGVRFEGHQRLGRDLGLATLRQRGFRAILLALGTQRSARPNVSGSLLPGVVDALSFLAERPPLTDQEIVVVGGGDVAIDAARTALRLGARGVTLVCAEPEEGMTAARDTVLQARAEGLKLQSDRAISAIGAIMALRSQGHLELQLGRVVGFRREGRGVAWERLDPAQALPASRVVFATGLVADLAGLDLPDGLRTADGWLKADDFGRTTSPDLFVAGDVHTGPATVTAAMAAGVRAAFAIDEALSSPGRTVAPPAAPTPRPRPALPHGAPRPEALREPNSTRSEAQARAEAGRCLLCGLCANCNACVELFACPAIARDAVGDRPRILTELCGACGACVQVCPNEAIGVYA